MSRWCVRTQALPVQGKNIGISCHAQLQGSTALVFQTLPALDVLHNFIYMRAVSVLYM